MERVLEFLDAEELSPEPAPSIDPPPVKGRVAFENVSFSYDPDEPLIEDLSVVAEPGQTVAIVGPTGAGKTTLVNLIMRFYELDDGRITLDGRDIASMPRSELRSKIGIVFEDTFLFSDTVRANIAFGRPDAPMDEVVRLHASSGTTGKPIVVAYTQRDLDTWSELMARTLRAGGVGRSDVVHNAYGYGLFTGGLGFHYGAERIGATVIPMSGGFTARQLTALRDFGSTVLCCTPSYSLHLAEALAASGTRPVDLKLRLGFFGAEPWPEVPRAIRRIPRGTFSVVATPT
jgi:hypothetical protein